jgi:copper(I)-binding protein
MARLVTPTLLLVLFVIATPGWAHDYTVGKIRIDHPWARASVVRNGAAYATIENRGDKVDRLIAVTCPLARKAELHTHVLDSGIVRMRRVKAIEVHPGTPTVLKPGGLHIMLFGLKKHLKEGELIPLQLRFERAGTIKVEAIVQGAGDAEPHGMKHGKHDKHTH